MCSQPIVHATQLARVRACSTLSCSGDRFGASSKVPLWKLRVGSVPKRLNVSRFVAVPSSRYFAVAGPNDRFDRSRLNSVSSRGCAHSHALRAAHGDRLDVLAAEHGAAAAAAGVTAVVRDRRVADARAHRRDRSRRCGSRRQAARAASPPSPDTSRPRTSSAGSSRTSPSSMTSTDSAGARADDDDGVAAGSACRQGRSRCWPASR